MNTSDIFIDRNNRIIHPDDEIILENKNKRYLATFIKLDENDNIILKLNESGKLISIDKTESQPYISINENSIQYNQRDTSKQFFGELANEILNEQEQLLKPDIDINSINGFGLLLNEDININNKKEVELNRLKNLLTSSEILANKYKLTKIGRYINECLNNL